MKFSKQAILLLLIVTFSAGSTTLSFEKLKLENYWYEYRGENLIITSKDADKAKDRINKNDIKEAILNNKFKPCKIGEQYERWTYYRNPYDKSLSMISENSFKNLPQNIDIRSSRICGRSTISSLKKLYNSSVTDSEFVGNIEIRDSSFEGKTKIHFLGEIKPLKIRYVHAYKNSDVDITINDLFEAGFNHVIEDVKIYGKFLALIYKLDQIIDSQFMNEVKIVATTFISVDKLIAEGTLDLNGEVIQINESYIYGSIIGGCYTNTKISSSTINSTLTLDECHNLSISGSVFSGPMIMKGRLDIAGTSFEQGGSISICKNCPSYATGRVGGNIGGYVDIESPNALSVYAFISGNLSVRANCRRPVYLRVYHYENYTYEFQTYGDVSCTFNNGTESCSNRDWCDAI